MELATQQKQIFDLSLDEKKKLLKRLLNEHAQTDGDHDTCSDQEPAPDHPLSAGQWGLWMIYQLAPDNYAYNAPGAFRVKGRINTGALIHALDQLVMRHPALRGRIDVKDNQPRFVIEPSVNYFFQAQSVAHLPEADLPAFLQAIAKEPFKPGIGALLRVYLFFRSTTESIVLFNFHHIIVDGSSFPIFMKELNVFYNASITQTPHGLKPPDAGYDAFVQWQADLIRGEKGRRHRQYWLQKLGGELPVLNLPIDRPRPAVQTFSGDCHAVEISAARIDQLKKLAANHKASVFSVMLSLFNILLFRYTRQEDLLVGTPFVGRPRSRFERVIGYFVNMVVIRTAISDTMSFGQLLAHVQATALEAMEHGHFPFAQIVSGLGLRQDRSQSPVFQAAFVFQNWTRDLEAWSSPAPGAAGDDGEELTFTPMPGIRQVGEFELTLEVVMSNEALCLYFKYNPDLFEKTTITRMAGHYATLLESLVSDGDQPIRRMPLLTPLERHRILHEFNDTGVDYPQGLCMHQVFEEQVRKTPDALALVFEDQRLTYAQFNMRANQLAHRLINLGAGPNVFVGILAERSLEMVIAIYAILKAGAAYVPLDPAHPAERLAYMITDTGMPVILAQRELGDRLPEHSATVVHLDGLDDAALSEPATNPGVAVGESDLAYVIYTSGSTGTPKGVMVQHKAIRNRIMWIQDSYPLTHQDRFLQKTPFSFDVSVNEFFWPLCNGATLVIARPRGHKDSAYLVDVIQAQRISVLHFVPSMLGIFLEEKDLEKCTTLRRVLASGEALPYKLQTLFFKKLEADLINLYGPTEAAVEVSCWECQRDSTHPTVPIGRPIANTRLYILDPHLNPVPVGVPGELYIGGVQLAKGYINRPGLTREHFLPDPFTETCGARLYKTGDLCRFLPDGVIEYLGRTDFQVKIRGFRIELGEIEAVLQKHPHILEAVVVADEDGSGHKFLTAFFSAKNRAAIPVSALKDFLKQSLPEYMVPAFFIQLDALPLSTSGKVDRKALHSRRETPAARQTAHVAPTDKIEKQIAGLWRKVLGLTTLSIHDDFTDLGADSIKLMEVHVRLRKLFSWDIPLVALVNHPTVHRLARYLKVNVPDRLQKKTTDGFTPLVSIQPTGRKRPIFCVHPGFGYVTGFTELAREMGNDQPFYGIAAYGLDPRTRPLSGFETMAAAYIDAISTICPNGPYILAGFCAGGIIAYEMARQLTEQGRPVELLMLLDSTAPALYKPIFDDNDARHYVGFLRDFGGFHTICLLDYYCRIKGVDPCEDIETSVYQSALALSAQERLEILWQCACETRLLSPEVGMDYLERVLNVYCRGFSSLLQYNAQPYDGRTVLFKASDGVCRHAGITDPLTLGWQALAPNLNVIEIQGDHFSILGRPHVSALAGRMKQVLTDFRG